MRNLTLIGRYLRLKRPFVGIAIVVFAFYLRVLNIIGKSWRGEQSLARVFWGCCVGFPIAFLLVLALFDRVLPKSLAPFVDTAAVLFLLFWILVSIWRCAKNSKPVWKVLARVSVGIVAYTVVIGFLYGIYNISFPLRFDVSVPEGIPAGAVGEVSDEIISLKFPELKLSAEIQNYRAEGWGSPRLLGVWLGLEIIDNTFALDPGLVILKTDDGNSLKPLTFMGPANPWKSSKAVAMGCGPRRYSWGLAISRIDVSGEDIERGNIERGVLKPVAGSLPVQGQKCFMFWFDVDPSPDRPLLLSVQGITKAGKEFPVPDIQFTKGSVRKYWSF